MIAQTRAIRLLRTLLLATILTCILTLATPTNIYAGEDMSSTTSFHDSNRGNGKCQCGW